MVENGKLRKTPKMNELGENERHLVISLISKTQ
jgi:hypothetical protein